VNVKRPVAGQVNPRATQSLDNERLAEGVQITGFKHISGLHTIRRDSVI